MVSLSVFTLLHLSLQHFSSWAVLLHLVESVCCSEPDSPMALSCPLAPTLPRLLGDHPRISEKKLDARHTSGRRKNCLDHPSGGQGTAPVWEMDLRGGSCFLAESSALGQPQEEESEVRGRVERRWGLRCEGPAPTQGDHQKWR